MQDRFYVSNYIIYILFVCDLGIAALLRRRRRGRRPGERWRGERGVKIQVGGDGHFLGRAEGVELFWHIILLVTVESVQSARS